MALKKSQLYSSLWQSCDELRGGMDASQYKDYILTLLFMKYVTDKSVSDSNFLIDVPQGGSFTDMVKLKGDKEIGDKINKIIGKLAEANDLKGVIDEADFNDEDKLGRGQEMQDRLSKLVAIFDALDFQANRAEGDDLLGDAYEYLMRHFATESGKSKGQFYTPAEVSRIMAKVVGITTKTRQDQTIYDPTCGSGSLLIKAADEAGPGGMSIYGQENDNATWALARMNMILHGHPTADLWRGNTLAAPHFKNNDGSLKTFDFAVANPPFSLKAWTSGFSPDNDEYGRFEYGVPPAKNGDYAFLLHVIASLKSKGKAAIIMPHGVLFRGNKEADIRKNLITRGLIKGIIGLPANLFYGTGIPACIVVIDKENAHARSGIFMVDASKGFQKDGNKNRLRSQDIHKIVDVFNHQIEQPRYSRMVPVNEIADPSNDYNLNIPRYIDSSEPEDLHDLEAHLRGGIPNRDIDALQEYWDVFPSLRKVLFIEANSPAAKVPAGMHPAYFETHFIHDADWDDPPSQFAIITAYATTGKTWTNGQNEQADAKLQQELLKRKLWCRRLTGYSPTTGHAEPGWAAEMSLEAACELGRGYQQDAVYFVQREKLSVSSCEHPKLVLVGNFPERLHLTGTEPTGLRPGFSAARVEASQVKPTILAHDEFAAYQQRVSTIFDQWRTAHSKRLHKLKVDDLPRQVIHELSEDLLTRFADVPLLSRYDVYQRLMDYWADVMQDDVYLIAGDGWQEAAKPRGVIDDKEKKIKETPDLVVKRKKYKMDLIPPPLIVARYFANKQAEIDALQAKQDEATQALEEYTEEHAVEERLLEEALNDKGKVTKSSVNDRLKALQDEPDSDEEEAALKRCLELMDAESDAKKAVKDAQEKLDAAVLKKYAALSEAEIKTLAVDDKWFMSIQVSIEGEVNRITQRLADRVKELNERYSDTMSALGNLVELLGAKVDGHLKQMGLVWE